MIAATLLACLFALAPTALCAPLSVPPAVLVARAAEVEVQMQLTPSNAEVGLVMELKLVISGDSGADTQMVELPETEGARLSLVAGPEHMSRPLRTLSGRRERSITTTWRVEVVPERVGDILIPPIRFQSRGRDLFSDAFQFTSTAARFPVEALQLKLSVSSETMYVGEVIDLDLEAVIPEEFFTRRLSRGGLTIEVPWLDGLRGFHRQPSPTAGATETVPMFPSGIKLPFRVTRESIKGNDHIVLRTQIPLLASTPGEYLLDACRLGMRVAVETREERDFFSRPTLIPTRIVEINARTDAPLLSVRPTPLAGRPNDYVDAVGRFDLNGDVFPRDLAVGESCRLQLMLTRAAGHPEGNLGLLSWPSFEDQLSDFRIFGKEESKQPGRRMLIFELSPRRANVSAIPRLSLVSFDTNEGRYVSTSTGPFPLTVKAGVDLELPSLASSDDRLRDLDSIRVQLDAPRSSLPWWWLMPLAGGALLLAVDFNERRKHWRAGNSGELRRRGALGAFNQVLSAADDTASVAKAFACYLAARCAGPEAGFTREEALREFADRGHGELSDELGRVLEIWELAYLGGGRLDVAEARDQARSLAKRVEALT